MERKIYTRMAEVEDDHWWFISRRNIVAGLLDRLGLPEKISILEVGCGTGGNLTMLARRGRVYAIEPDDEARSFAEARGQAEIRPGCLPNDIGFANMCFDLVIMTDVLEHLDDDAAALRAVRTRLKPGGALLLTVPGMEWLWSAHDVAHHHRRRYRERQLRALAIDTGYEVRYLSYYNFLLFPVIAAARLTQRLTGVSGEGHDLRMPSPFVNRTLSRIFSSERHLIGRMSVPLGVSLMLLARKQDQVSSSVATDGRESQQSQ